MGIAGDNAFRLFLQGASQYKIIVAVRANRLLIRYAQCKDCKCS